MQDFSLGKYSIRMFIDWTHSRPSVFEVLNMISVCDDYTEAMFLTDVFHISSPCCGLIQ